MLESQQIAIYFGAFGTGAIAAGLIPGTVALEATINPALALMLFVTFLQVPLADLTKLFDRIGFIAALLITNFIAIPLFILVLVQFLPADPIIQLGVLLVLLTPCIDYVVTFSHLGRADSRLLLAATPLLLILQMLFLPVYLGLFLGANAADVVKLGPFVHAFVWLIAIPLVLSGLFQLWASRSAFAKLWLTALGVMPVPATAIVLLVVVANAVPQLGLASNAALKVIPIYVAFAIFAPIIGWWFGRLFGLDAPAGRAIAFSAGTRNSLVVLPLAFAVPGAMPVLPVIIVTQTLVELLSELAYVRIISKFGSDTAAPST
jgi:ACR3 family arsenite efflux pump ArsB